MNAKFTSSEAAQAGRCLPVTLRAWRNRQGLFPHLAGGGGWVRYSFEEIVTIRLLSMLSHRGVEAQPAVNLMNELFDARIPHTATASTNRWVAIGFADDGERFEWKSFGPAQRLSDTLLTFDDEAVIVLNVHTAGWQVFYALRDMRGAEGIFEEEAGSIGF